MDGIQVQAAAQGETVLFFFESSLGEMAHHRTEKVVVLMKIGFIGAGKVGFALGKYFCIHGIEVAGYYSRSIQSAAEAADFTGTAPYAAAEDLLSDSDVLFFTVPDDAVASCYKQLCVRPIQGKIFCHTSGAMTAEEAFSGIEALGAFGYSVHPLFAVSDKLRSYSELTDVFFTLEGSGAQRDFMLDWLLEAGLHVQLIDSAVKAKYHAAAAIVSNHVVALFDEAQGLLAECGFAPAAARQALGRIFTSNARHVAEQGAAAALTGPVQRGDMGTLAKHLAVLGSHEDRLLYLLLSRRLVKLAKIKNPAYDDTAIQKFLADEYDEVLALANSGRAGRKDEH